MRCDYCKHWNKEEKRRASGLLFGECRRAAQWWEATEWSDKPDPDEDWSNLRVLKPEFAAVKMFVQDGSDYRATLYTAPDFYCANHELIETRHKPPPLKQKSRQPVKASG